MVCKGYINDYWICLLLSDHFRARGKGITFKVSTCLIFQLSGSTYLALLLESCKISLSCESLLHSLRNFSSAHNLVHKRFPWKRKNIFIWYIPPCCAYQPIQPNRRSFPLLHILRMCLTTFYREGCKHAAFIVPSVGLIISLGKWSIWRPYLSVLSHYMFLVAECPYTSLAVLPSKPSFKKICQ